MQNGKTNDWKWMIWGAIAITITTTNKGEAPRQQRGAFLA